MYLGNIQLPNLKTMLHSAVRDKDNNRVATDFIKFYNRTKASWQQHGTFANTYSVSMCAFITHSCDTCREGRLQNKTLLKKTEKHASKVPGFVTSPHAACSERHRALTWDCTRLLENDISRNSCWMNWATSISRQIMNA